MRIKKDHCLGKEEARKRVENIAETLSTKYGLQTSWVGDDMRIDGGGVKGCIVIADDSVAVEVKLGFALLMMESTIRTSLQEAMDEHLV